MRSTPAPTSTPRAHRTRLLRLGAVLAVGAIALAACSSDSDDTSTGSDSGDAQVIEVTISDAGCSPRQIAATAGPTTFVVTNDDSAAVTEFEVLDGDRILGEVENVIPGDERDFSMTLDEGSFTTYCPNGEFERGTLEVAGGAEGPAADEAAREEAVDTYLTYVKSQADKLIPATQAFAAAVKAGNIPLAKQLYASTRYYYESIEPIAESFGDLDPAIDIREPDTTTPDEFTGFHRIEKALWVDGNVSNMGPVADKLVADVMDLRSQINTVELEPSTIANGAVELINETSTSKITGEEEAYSHTDLSDFAANLAGAKAAFESVKSLLTSKDADLTAQLEQRFAAVQSGLDAYKGTDPTGNGYVLYTQLTPANTQQLSTTLDALAEPLSKVAAKLL